jgi:uncharacterized small protein (DUF1192 family)
MSIFGDEPPKKKAAHEINEDLSKLSIEELEERIGLLRAEISRIETAVADKRASADAAKTFFKG